MKLLNDQRGIGHVVEIVIIAVIIMGIGAFIWWRVASTSQSTGGDSNSSQLTTLEQAIANATCEYDDQDLCKFLTGYEVTFDLKVESTQTMDGETTKSTLISTEKGVNSHMLMDVNGVPFEFITIGNTRYTKDNSDGAWWKQTVEVSSADDTVVSTEDYQPEFEEPSATEEPSTTTYKRIGTEACGSFTCFKYQVLDPTATDVAQYIWFDNQKYQMRRMLMEYPNSKYDQTYSYENISVSAPSPTKDLPSGQYLVPGSSSPVSMPDFSGVQAE